MKKKNSKEMAEVMKLVDYLKPIFFLQGWWIDISLYDKDDPDEPNTAAKIHPKNCYKTASLYIYPRFFRENEEEKRDIIVHEFCHIPAGIQNGLINTARKGVQVTDQEASYAFEEETSWFEHIIAKLIPVDKPVAKKKRR